MLVAQQLKMQYIFGVWLVVCNSEYLLSSLGHAIVINILIGLGVGAGVVGRAGGGLLCVPTFCECRIDGDAIWSHGAVSCGVLLGEALCTRQDGKHQAADMNMPSDLFEEMTY